MTLKTSNPTTPSRTDFCALLRQHRDERKLSLDQVAAETRIPLRSLERLEDGKFEELPADVFVRGFLRSYARCVGLDSDDVLRRYGRLGFEAAPVASDMASDLMAQMRSVNAPEPRQRVARGTEAPPVDEASTSATKSIEWLQWLKKGRSGSPAVASKSDVEVAEEVVREEPKRIFLPRDFEDSDAKRGSLTVAVIFLVIVATITMSYLMRRPSHAGDGISTAPSISETTGDSTVS